jgi:glycerol-3-phosphate cytidylyltransferase
MLAQPVEVLVALFFALKVILQNSRVKKVNHIKEHALDMFSMDDDSRGYYVDFANYREVCYLQRTNEISSTEVKRTLEETLNITNV